MTPLPQLVAFDLDGTLIKSHLDTVDGELREVRPYGDVAYRDYVLSTVQALARHGVGLAIVTNQAGVAFGHVHYEDACRKLRFVAGHLAVFCGGAWSVHACFSHPNATVERWATGSERRKPAPAMLEEAMAAHRVGPERTLYVGDLPSDEACARAASVAYAHEGEYFTLERVEALLPQT